MDPCIQLSSEGRGIVVNALVEASISGHSQQTSVEWMGINLR